MALLATEVLLFGLMWSFRRRMTVQTAMFVVIGRATLDRGKSVRWSFFSDVYLQGGMAK